MRVSPDGSIEILLNILVADIQPAEISDATVDQKDLAMVSLTRFELRKPSQRRVEFDHFGARPDERRKGPSIESVGSDCIEDDSNGDALPHAIFETRDEPLARFIRAQDIGLEMDVFPRSFDRGEHGIDGGSPAMEEFDAMPRLVAGDFAWS